MSPQLPPSVRTAIDETIADMLSIKLPSFLIDQLSLPATKPRIRDQTPVQRSSYLELIQIWVHNNQLENCKCKIIFRFKPIACTDS